MAMMENIVYGITIIGAVVGYTAALLTYVKGMIEEHGSGCTGMNTTRFDAINKRIDETNNTVHDVITNYKERFQDIKKDIQNVKQDIMERLDLVIEKLGKRE